MQQNEVIESEDNNIQVKSLRCEMFNMLGLPSILYAILFTLCMYENRNGITMPIWIGATVYYVFYVCKKAGSRWNKGCTITASAMILLGISTVLTGNWLIIFGNYAVFLFTLLLLLMMLTSQTIHWGIVSLCGRMLSAIAGAIGKVAEPVLDFLSWIHLYKRKPSKKHIEIVMGCLIAIPCVVILGAILASADVVFRNMLIHFSFEVKMPFNVVTITLMIAFGLFSSYCGMHYFLKHQSMREQKASMKRPSTIAITFSSMILALYVVFCAIQVIYLFAGLGELPEGMTNAEYARQGFFQLLFVAFLNLIFVFVIKYLFEDHKVLNWILLGICACTYVMCASSCYRMLLYIQAYHLTVLRLLVLFALAFIGVFFAGVIIWLFKYKFPIYQFGLCVMIGAWLILSFSHIDYLVARYDYNYCKDDDATLRYITTLSTDAAPVLGDYMNQNIGIKNEVKKAVHTGLRSRNSYESLISTNAYYIVKFYDRNVNHVENSSKSLRKWNWSYANFKSSFEL